MEKSINIPNHGGQVKYIDKEILIGVNEEFVEFLCNFVSPDKISQLPSHTKRELSDEMALIKNLHKNKFNEVLKIMKCLKCLSNELNVITSCNHGFCTVCITSHIHDKTMGNIVLNEFEAKTPNTISACCPKCDRPLTETDLKSVYSDIEPYKLNAKMRKIEVELPKGYFHCINCNKKRGSHQYMKKTCGHMCKNCFSKRGCEQLNGTCEICGMIINEEVCDNSKLNCGNCKKEFYLIGDFMQEVCLNQFFCPSCACDMVDRGVCSCHNKVIPYNKKLEITLLTYRTCNNCHVEKLIGSFIRHRCCKASICFDCNSQSSSCLACGSRFNERILKSIAEHFQGS